MPKNIEVPDVGVVEFPDEMGDTEISAAISNMQGLGQNDPGVSPALRQEASKQSAMQPTPAPQAPKPSDYLSQRQELLSNVQRIRGDKEKQRQQVKNQPTIEKPQHVVSTQGPIKDFLGPANLQSAASWIHPALVPVGRAADYALNMEDDPRLEHLGVKDRLKTGFNDAVKHPFLTAIDVGTPYVTGKIAEHVFGPEGTARTKFADSTGKTNAERILGGQEAKKLGLAPVKRGAKQVLKETAEAAGKPAGAKFNLPRELAEDFGEPDFHEPVQDILRGEAGKLSHEAVSRLSKEGGAGAIPPRTALGRLGSSRPLATRDVDANIAAGQNAAGELSKDFGAKAKEGRKAEDLTATVDSTRKALGNLSDTGLEKNKALLESSKRIASKKLKDKGRTADVYNKTKSIPEAATDPEHMAVRNEAVDVAREKKSAAGALTAAQKKLYSLSGDPSMAPQNARDSAILGGLSDAAKPHHPLIDIPHLSGAIPRAGLHIAPELGGLLPESMENRALMEPRGLLAAESMKRGIPVEDPQALDYLKKVTHAGAPGLLLKNPAVGPTLRNLGEYGANSAVHNKMNQERTKADSVMGNRPPPPVPQGRGGPPTGMHQATPVRTAPPQVNIPQGKANADEFDPNTEYNPDATRRILMNVRPEQGAKEHAGQSGQTSERDGRLKSLLQQYQQMKQAQDPKNADSKAAAAEFLVNSNPGKHLRR